VTASQPLTRVLRPARPEPSPLTCAATDNAVTCALLGVLYASTGGASWTNKANWALSAGSTATSYCSFYGISGFTVPCNVTNPPPITKMCVRARTLLHDGAWCHARPRASRPLRSHRLRRGLYNNNLVGTLPSSFGGLTDLTYLCVPAHLCCARTAV
jgi:hypothetical protein